MKLILSKLLLRALLLHGTRVAAAFPWAHNEVRSIDTRSLSTVVPDEDIVQRGNSTMTSDTDHADLGRFDGGIDMSDNGQYVIASEFNGNGVTVNRLHVYEWNESDDKYDLLQYIDLMDAKNGSTRGAISGNGKFIATSNPWYSVPGLDEVGRSEVWQFNEVTNNFDILVGEVQGDERREKTGAGAYAFSQDGSKLFIGDGTQYENVAGKARIDVYIFDEGNNQFDLTSPSYTIYEPTVYSDERFGGTISVSGDGNRFIAGDYYVQQAYVFALDDTGNVYQQVGSPLTGLEDSGNNFAKQVAMSLDGNVVVCSDAYYNNYFGAIYIYQLDGAEYNLIYTVIGDEAGARLGDHVAVSDNGDFILASSPWGGIRESGLVTMYCRVLSQGLTTYEKCNTIAQAEDVWYTRFGNNFVLKQDYVAIWSNSDDTRASRGKITVFEGLPIASTLVQLPAKLYLPAPNCTTSDSAIGVVTCRFTEIICPDNVTQSVKILDYECETDYDSTTNGNTSVVESSTSSTCDSDVSEFDAMAEVNYKSGHEGDVKFCIKTELIEGGEIMYYRSERVKMTFEYDGEFLVTSFNTSEYEGISKDDTVATKSFGVEADICNESGNKSTGSSALAIGDNLFVCIKTKDEGTRITAIPNFTAEKATDTSTGTESLVIDNSKSNVVVTGLGSEKLMVVINFPARFFTNTNVIVLKGNVEVEGTKSRRLLSPRALQEVTPDVTSDDATFGLVIDVVAELSSATGHNMMVAALLGVPALLLV